MWKHLAANTLTFLIVLCIVVAGVIGWAKNQYSAEGPLERAVCLRVSAGSSFRAVSDDLVELGALGNSMVFRVGADYQGRSHLLKAGSYLIEPGATMEGIVRQVTTAGRSTCGADINFRIGIARVQVDLRELDPASGDFVTKASFQPAQEAAPPVYLDALEDGDIRLRVTLAEGVTSWQVVEGLKSAGFLVGDVGPVPPEGTLAPDSYEVRPGTARVDVLASMVTRQSEILARAWATRAPDLPLETPQEALILASIIEKETAVADERRTIAQVFVNRLQQGIRLQTDPTVIYGITRGEGSLGRGLRQSELKRETPWNTYQIDGLPKTPISNPGAASIQAALNPDGSEFIFFVADGTGGHEFASTLREHNRNVAKWRAIEAERSNN